MYLPVVVLPRGLLIFAGSNLVIEYSEITWVCANLPEVLKNLPKNREMRQPGQTSGIYSKNGLKLLTLGIG